MGEGMEGGEDYFEEDGEDVVGEGQPQPAMRHNEPQPSVGFEGGQRFEGGQPRYEGQQRFEANQQRFEGGQPQRYEGQQRYDNRPRRHHQDHRQDRQDRQQRFNDPRNREREPRSFEPGPMADRPPTQHGDQAPLVPERSYVAPPPVEAAEAVAGGPSSQLRQDAMRRRPRPSPQAGGHEQPEFLRRSVRRTRAETAPQGAPGDTPGDEPGSQG
jgi:hypothetical protein